MGDITITPAVLALLPTIGPDGLSLYVFLKSRANAQGECWPGYEDIHSGTGLNRHRIAAAARLLENVGLVERKRRFSNSTIYIISANPALMEASSSALVALMDTPISAVVQQMDTPISADMALMEAENGQKSAISAETALPLVPNPHSNLRELINEYERCEKQDDETFDRMIERLLGCTIGAADVEALKQMQKSGVTEADVRAAIAWRMANGVQPARRAADIVKGALHEKRQRVQRSNAKAAPPPARAKKVAAGPGKSDAVQQHQAYLAMTPDERAQWEAAETARVQAMFAQRGIA